MDNTVYSNILFATDCGPQSLYIGQHAIKLGKICQATVQILHVVEPPMTYTANFSLHEKQIDETKTHASKSLHALCTQLELGIERSLIVIGSPQATILEISIKHKCDLIVIGSHGVGGYTHALGSTAHSLLENAHCDVLIVQVSHLEHAVKSAIPGEFLWQRQELPSPHLNSPRYGSEKGFGEVVKRGPRLTNRPYNSPYKGGTRTRTSEDESDPQNKSEEDG